MKIKIGSEDIAEKEESKNKKYELHYRYMHGDADFYEDQSMLIEDALELEFFYTLYGMAESADDIDEINIQNIAGVAKTYAEKGCKFLLDVKRDDPSFEEFAEDFFDDVPGDRTCDGCRKVSITEVFVTYHKDGKEFEVEIGEK